MEAHLFQDIYDAVENHENCLDLKVQYGSPIQTIVWSSFSYMIGPELKFVWHVKADEPYHLSSSDETSSDGNFPSTSSDVKSTQGSGLQYDDCINLMSNSNDCSNLSDDLESERKSSHQSAESQAGNSTLCSSSHPTSNSTLRLNKDENFDVHEERQEDLQEEDYETEDDNSSYTNVSEKEEEVEHQADNKLTTSIVDSGITGTVSVHSDLSGTCKSPKLNSSQSIMANLSDTSSEKSDYGYCDDKKEEDQISCSQDYDVAKCLDSTATASFLTVSNVLTEQSAVGDQFETEVREDALVRQESAAFSQMVENENYLSDEMFVAKYALAEQISNPCFAMNPMICKVSVIPSRQISIMSFLFSVPKDEKEMMAFSLVLSEEARDWLGVRENVFEQIFEDVLCRFKASYLSESIADVICRLTDDIYSLLLLFGNLERFPLCSQSYINIKSTVFMKPEMSLEDRSFLYKSVTGCLMSQGNCVLIGADPDYVEQFMLGLMLFLTPEQRTLCLKPHMSQYSPYLKLQAVKRELIEDLYVASAESHWPTCFIDVDRKLVTSSGSYFTHYERKERLALQQMGSIFVEAGQNLKSEDRLIAKREPIIEPMSVIADPFLSSRLDVLWLLPCERSTRSIVLNQLILTLDYQAKALIETIKDISEPSKTFKENAVSSKWSLNTVRKMLNLTADSSFNICLARADMLKPSLAQFIYQCNNHFR
ncbi:unnamed protein product [Bursaphelenchus xylophilus]|uniref:(pine wood nematode) hypothetical protein n=1 Tax=Bursaphelenchus xylophilus TaxID=6326 RepID=A0A1I7SVN5_BURXY|nr:unnamed protein product [Bursaphelenchus xylophilus]CAG9098000.1 unnamed protein product [Bursaphelenchus xylophilus]